MRWTETQEIAEKVVDNNPELEPKTIRFTDLYQWIIDLEGFDDDPDKCGERILAAIQLAWIEEYD